jgi:hypothetical protein
MVKASSLVLDLLQRLLGLSTALTRLGDSLIRGLRLRLLLRAQTLQHHLQRLRLRVSLLDAVLTLRD